MGESHGFSLSFLQDVRGGEQDKAVLRADRGGLSAAGGRGHDVAGEHEEPARADAELPLLQRLLLELPLQDVHRDRPLHLALSHLLVSSRYRALKMEGFFYHNHQHTLLYNLLYCPCTLFVV